MKRILTSPDTTELGLLRNMLQRAGIRCSEINEYMPQLIPAMPFQAELWVEEDADYPAAVALLEEWRNPTASGGTDWTCARCGEQLGSQFGKCWKCGTHRRTAS